jgi:protoheme IX farnesyltransferase
MLTEKDVVKQEALAPSPKLSTAIAYIEVLKPRETTLLTFTGICAGIVAAGGDFNLSRLLLVLATVALGSGGVNGLTNYLDREVDAKMQRTKHRSLPSKRIDPAEKALPLTAGLTIVGLGLAWLLNPYCFFAGIVGTITAVIFRKTVLCPFLGAISGCGPVLIGWFAFEPSLSPAILILCLLIFIWVPLHVWSVMIANREDYRAAGQTYFPLSRDAGGIVKLLPWLAIGLYASSIGLYLVGDFKQLYFVIANILGVAVVYASFKLRFSHSWQDAWRIYKLSAFPYLGILFLAMCLDVSLL